MCSKSSHACIRSVWQVVVAVLFCCRPMHNTVVTVSSKGVLSPNALLALWTPFTTIGTPCCCSHIGHSLLPCIGHFAVCWTASDSLRYIMCAVVVKLIAWWCTEFCCCCTAYRVELLFQPPGSQLLCHPGTTHKPQRWAQSCPVSLIGTALSLAATAAACFPRTLACSSKGRAGLL